MRFLQSLAFVLVSMVTFSLAAQEPIHKVTFPLEVKTEIKTATVPKEIEGLQWNRWTSKNFTVLALNDRHAKYLHDNLEQIKGWTFARWGFADQDFSSECKLICVDDPVLFEKLFKLNKSRVEIRRNDQGKIKETVIFLLANDAPSRTVPSPLMEVCLGELAQKHNANFGWWSYRGTAMLCRTSDQIASNVKDLGSKLSNNSPMFFSKALMETTQDQYSKLPDDQKQQFDSAAMVLCLMIRKEFGQDKFHFMLRDSSKPEVALRSNLRFESYNQFDKSFKQFMADLSKDVTADKTPDKYLQIVEKGH
jgi:hypothetical protein